MKNVVSIIKEKLPGEKRVILLPEHCRELEKRGYRVLVEKDAGINLGISNNEYQKCGCEVVSEREAWENANIVIKYKPPIKDEYKYLRDGLNLAALCHAEGNYPLIKEFIKNKMTVFSFEFIQTDSNYFPLAIPGGEIAGKVAFLYSMFYSQSHLGGSGMLPVGLNGKKSGVTVAVLGYGSVGASVIKMALSMGNRVVVFGRNVAKMKKMQVIFSEGVEFYECTEENLIKLLPEVNILIGAILESTYDTKEIISERMIELMPLGAVIIDVTCGYGERGYMPFFKKATSLFEPTYKFKDRIYIKIDNLPCAFHKTTTYSYSNNVAPYVAKICDFVLKEIEDQEVNAGCIVKEGQIVHDVLRRHFKYYENNRL